ncbi:MAG: hypothetical protein D6689_06325 [Deltaproteobacteria bacterium]|nr:MAG: hypothetical protein D6689_06325 [Deltaproteobacteria bacterium]
MARRDLAAELAQKPLGVKLAVLGGVLAFLGFFYWQFFYSTLADEKRGLQAERSRLLREETSLKERERAWIELLQKKEELDEELKKNQVTLPASSELPAFFMHLQKQASAAGVTITKWARRNESAVDTYVKVPVALEVTGTYYQIKNYFYLLSKTDRIISIGSLRLLPHDVKSDEITLKASFVAMTFRQKDKPPDTSLGELEPEEGGPPAPKRGTRAGAGQFAKRALEGSAPAPQPGAQPPPKPAPQPKPGAQPKPAPQPKPGAADNASGGTQQ